MMQKVDKSFETSKECDEKILLKENESLKLEIHSLKQIIQNKTGKDNLFPVINDLIKENEGMKDTLKHLTQEETKNNTDTLQTTTTTTPKHSSSPNTKLNALPTIMETNIMMEESTTTTTTTCSPRKLFQDDTIMEQQQIQKGNNGVTYTRTLQEEVTRLKNEITVLKEEEKNQTSTLQNEIQRLTKELTDTKLYNKRNNNDDDDSEVDRGSSSSQRRKQFHQMERLIESFMEKDIEIQELKKEMKSLRQKLLQSGKMSHFILNDSHNDMDSDEANINIFVRLFRRNSNSSMRTSQSSSIIQEYPPYKSMYEDLKPINEDMRKQLEILTKEYNLTKFKLKEEQERSTKDLETFAVALHGVDELRTAVEEMSRELKRKGGTSSSDPSSTFEKLQSSNYDNLDIMPKKDGINNNNINTIWTGIMKARRSSVPHKENRRKRKDKGRKKPRISDDSSVVTSAF